MTLRRLDQGRLDYLKVDEIKRIALAVADINGIPKPNSDDDILRQALSIQSAPISPAHYTVWRNYKKVLDCILLATEVAGRVVCKDLCKALETDSNEIDIDDSGDCSPLFWVHSSERPYLRAFFNGEQH